MADISIVLGGDKKKKLQPVDNTLQPISQTAQSRIESDKIRTGTSTMQGTNGYAQGPQGYKAQMPTAGYDKINPVIQNIMAPTKKYDMPEFDQNKSVLSNDWFNTALKRIQIHNQMKMDMKRRETLNSLLGNLLKSRDNVYDTTASVGARMRGQDLRYGLGQDQLKEQQRYHDILNQYYGGQLNAQLRGQDIKKELADEKLAWRENTQNPINDQIKRIRSVTPDRFKLMLPEDIADEIGTDNLNKAYRYFIQTGQVPQFKKVDGWFDTDYEPVFGQNGSANSNNGSTPEEKSQAKPIGFDPYLKKNLIAKKVIDGKEYYKTEDGTWITY